MNCDVLNVPQRSEAWFAARCGLFTGSVAADMLATIKSGEAAARRDLRTTLVVERLTGNSQDDRYVNAVMQRGIDLEPAARRAYEARTGYIVRTTGFLKHRTLKVGASLDGHVGEMKRLVSFKCPKSATHLRYIRAGVMPSDYVGQMLHEMWLVPSAEFYDFVSFDDRFPVELQTFMVSVPRDEKAIREYEKKALAFLDEVDLEEASVRTAMSVKVA